MYRKTSIEKSIFTEAIGKGLATLPLSYLQLVQSTSLVKIMIRTNSCVIQQLTILGAFSRFAQLKPSHGILFTLIIFTQPRIKRGIQWIYMYSTLFQTFCKKEHPHSSCKNCSNANYFHQIQTNSPQNYTFGKASGL